MIGKRLKKVGLRAGMLPVACVTMATLLPLQGCKRDAKQTKLLYMPDMVDTPVAKPQRSYLEPPEGSISRNAMLYPPADKIDEWEKLLHNPYIGHPQEARFRAEGAVLFHDNCSPCHGPAAKGNGTMLDKFPPPPDITSEPYASRSDGFLFHKITVGGPIMPSRGEQTFPHERWKIILHLRELQKPQASQPSAPEESPN